ncbi:MAG TPA: hypothetical protein DD727_00100, partial [Clostridiales bacterium]|nr:hypothetical protein [Clostridiales bacterium]
MKVDFAQIKTPASSPAVSLESIWLLEADPSYAVKNGNTSGDRLIALRTLKGLGELRFSSGEVLEPGPGTMVFFHHRDIRYYGCQGGEWHFRWYSYYTSGVSMPLRRRQLIQIREHPDEAAVSEECIRLLHIGSREAMSLASSLFCTLWGRWIMELKTTEPFLGDFPDIQKALDLISSGLQTPLTVKLLATAVNLSPRRFHDFFKAWTGMTPGQFIGSLRIRR